MVYKKAASPDRRLFLTLFLLMTLSACSSVELVSQWRNPSARPVDPQKFLVLAELHEIALERNLEDQLTEELKLRGFSAIQSYRVRIAAGAEQSAGNTGLRERAGANALLRVHIVGRETRTQIIPQPYPDPFWGYPAYYWPGPYYPYAYQEQVYQYQVLIVEAEVLNLPADTLIWAGSFQTMDENLRRHTGELAKSILNGYFSGAGSPLTLPAEAGG